MRTITQHYIGGRFVESHGQGFRDIVNPTTGETIGMGIQGDAEDARAAVAAAKAALPGWSATSLEERRQYLQNIADSLDRHRDELAEVMTEEYGAIAAFSGFTIAQARDFFLQAKALLVPETFEERLGDAVVRKVPVGVAALITPWNGSAWFLAMKAAVALASGSTVVMKPSDRSYQESDAFIRALDEAGLPAGVINLVFGPGSVIGDELTANADVDKISFTGSTAVGKRIAANAAQTMKRVTLELGGKGPTVILDDADLAEAVPFALSVGLFNSGQACISGSRILAPRHRLDEVRAALKSGIEQFKVGDPRSADTMVGPMVTSEHYESVQSYIRKGVAEGASVLVGGEGHPDGLAAGSFAKPTILDDVTNDMAVAQEEIFGPVLSLIAYDDDEEAVRIANDSRYGLTAYVATRDEERGRAVADRIEAGRTMVNQFFDDKEAPFGGMKESGVGREFGKYGLEAYLETKTVYSR
jgi:aldehyde dehydrogenase (NAD+)